MDVFDEQLNALIAADLLDSAEVFCSLHLSPTTSATASLRIAERQADIMVLRGEHKRALAQYHQVEAAGKSSRGAEGLRVKMARSYMALRDHSSALRELRLVPARSRDTQTNVLLARLYRLSGLREQAAAALKEVLAQLPFAVEVVEGLVDLGADAGELLTVVEARLGSGSGGSGGEGWAVALTKTLLGRRDHDSDRALTLLAQLLHQFPGNAYLQAQACACYAQTERHNATLAAFRNLRVLEPFGTRGMNRYAMLLFRLGGTREQAELCRLAAELMALEGPGATRSASAWVAAALYSESRGDADRAMTFAENAVRSSPHDALVYSVKGQLLMGRNSLEQAIVCLRQSNACQRGVETYAALVRAHLGLGQLREAAACAKDCLELAPRAAMSHLLQGKVLDKNNKHADSLRAYSAALRLAPDSPACAVAKAEAELALSRKQDAIETLQQSVALSPAASTRLLLGKVYASAGLFEQAMDQLQMVIAKGGSGSGSGFGDGSEQVEAQEEVDRIEAQLSAAAEEDEDEEAFYEPSGQHTPGYVEV